MLGWETERAEGDERMGMGRSSAGGEFDLSDPANSFVEVVRRVVLQPVRFFAGLPRGGEVTDVDKRGKPRQEAK